MAKNAANFAVGEIEAFLIHEAALLDVGGSRNGWR